MRRRELVDSLREGIGKLRAAGVGGDEGDAAAAGGGGGPSVVTGAARARV